MSIDLNTKSLVEIESLLLREIEQIQIHQQNIQILQEARKRAAERGQKLPDASRHEPVTNA